MHHVRKIVEIACTLSCPIVNRGAALNAEDIYNFISVMSEYGYNMRKFNEKIALGVDVVAYGRMRRDLQNSIALYLYKHPLHITERELEFRHDPREVPVLLKLGKAFSNHNDNESFVIDL